MMFERISTSALNPTSNNLMHMKTMPKKRPFSMHEIDDFLETDSLKTTDHSNFAINDVSGRTIKRIKLCKNNPPILMKENSNCNSILDLYK